MTDNVFVLCSSNSNRDYLLDAIEVIGRPRGHIMHFRYRKKWVDNDLWEHLPTKGQTDQTSSIDSKVLLVSVHQQEISPDHQVEWKYAYPIRFGKIKEYYRTGNDSNDIGYFYFEVQDYCASADGNYDEKRLTATSNEILKNMFMADGSRVFAATRQLSTILPASEATISDDSSFQSTAGRFNSEHFQSVNGAKKYFPVFVKVNPINSAELSSYDRSLRQRSYRLLESHDYIIETDIYLNDIPGNDSAIKLQCPESQFIYPHSTTKIIASPYDEIIWRIIPSKVSNDISTAIQI